MDGQLANWNDGSSLSGSGQHRAVIISGGRRLPRPRPCSCAGAPTHTALWAARKFYARAALHAGGQGVLEGDRRRWRTVKPASGPGARRTMGMRAAHARGCSGRSSASAGRRHLGPNEKGALQPGTRALAPLNRPEGRARWSRRSAGRMTAWARGAVFSFVYCMGRATRADGCPPPAWRSDSGTRPRCAHLMMLRATGGARCRYGTIRLQLESTSLGTVALPPNESVRARRDGACLGPSHVPCQVAISANPAPSPPRLATRYHILIRRARDTTNDKADITAG